MKPLFTKLEQIAFVVDDLEKAMDVFVGLGIGPWSILRFGDPGDHSPNNIGIADVVLRGRKTETYAIKNGVCVLPESGVELELIQPLAGESIFAEYLEKHGAGVQHLSIAHGDFEESMARIEATGHGRSQTAAVDVTELCVFSDHRDVIGTDLELHRRPENFQKPDIEDEFYPAGGVMPEGKVQISCISELKIVTGSVKTAVELLEGAYGIGPWEYGDGCASCDALNVRLTLAEAGKNAGYGDEVYKAHGADSFACVLRTTPDFDAQSFAADRTAELGVRFEIES